jgi:hypothetical protein
MTPSIPSDPPPAVLKRRYALPRRLGLIFAGVHLAIVVVFAAFILVLSMRPVAQWQLTWLYLEPIDWPVSQLLWWEGWPRGPYEHLPYALQDPFWFVVPLFLFGVLGSAWYGLIGGAIGYVVQRFRHGRAAA